VHCIELASVDLRIEIDDWRGVFVKRLTTLFAVVTIVFALSHCRGRESGADAGTETIAPAKPQPDDTGTDAMTQTVDIEDSRSEAEGASLTQGQQPPTATTATTATATTSTAPAKKPPTQQ
jgi:hypothetical protein